MPEYIQTWTWEEAFYKFGFGDGDDWVGTSLIAQFLEKLGYEVDYDSWGCHNVCISELSKNGVSLLPEEYPEDDEKRMGYADPNDYLPDDLVQKLNNYFDANYIINN